MTAPILIIGYGNELRGDDALGVVAAQLLEQAFPPEQVQVIVTHQLMPEMAEPLSQARLAVLIDASVKLKPGQILLEPLAPVTQTTVRDTHGVAAAELMGCARLLYGSCAPTWMACVGGEDFSLKQGLTPAVAEATRRLVDQVRQLVGKFLSENATIAGTSEPPNA